MKYNNLYHCIFKDLKFNTANKNKLFTTTFEIVFFLLIKEKTN